MALALIEREVFALGGQPKLREGFVTDNGNLIVDVEGLVISDPPALELEVNQWPGVVTMGVFARNRASVCLLGTPEGVQGVATYMAIYLAMTLGTFACILAMRRKDGYVETIEDLAGLGRERGIEGLREFQMVTTFNLGA